MKQMNVYFISADFEGMGAPPIKQENYFNEGIMLSYLITLN